MHDLENHISVGDLEYNMDGQVLVDGAGSLCVSAEIMGLNFLPLLSLALGPTLGFSYYRRAGSF
ncbi:hypothetical protein SODALDRAFT_333583 [Sodiomyces alkalinus F11]|uniref:Uncharacterized protein n=1 Tax=Sodiomyces alkalinus (strain CBS 110278 / VKM F-3762 / F11) TaxID=1314773 RepID=A0A3N2PTS1_SODAK|nr:hypothetical protein SODALDRAFT_333583 [Sodiomyces alkalinus F11]ROT37834.1 hypothetical protein SODALDRAFT_333583 [Sodiomyces alkalinus F11]